MPKEDKRECFRILGIENGSSEYEIKKAYKRLALQCHPDKNQSDSGGKRFEEVSKAFESLSVGYDPVRQDCDLVFFEFLRDIFGWKEDGANCSSKFFLHFCGSKQHPCSSAGDNDYDLRYQENEDEEDIDGERDLDNILEIVKNRKQEGKHVPANFEEGKLIELKTKLFQHKEDMRRDPSKKQTNKKGKTPVPVAKPKPKSKKQLLAEQRRREKEMEQIAMELGEKRKEEEEKDKQRKQLEIEKQKRQEEERIKAQNEERKRREREQKERERQQKLEQEKEEKRRRQQEEERRRKEEEEKRRKAEKEKADKEKAAKKAAQQAAKEKEEQLKAAKNQNNKRTQQVRTDQQQYPREIPPRFQKKMKQQQQQQQQQQQHTQIQSQMVQPAPSQVQSQVQQTPVKAQAKPQPAVGKKKDPNRFASKEFAGIIEQGDDGGWATAPAAKGTGWGNSLETWDDTEKWGVEDRQWGNKEGTWDKVVVDDSDKDSWPMVNPKGAVTNAIKSTSVVSASPEKGKNSSYSSPRTSMLSNSSGLASFPQTTSNNKSSNNSKWQSSVYPATGENWDIACDDSIDKAIDAAEAANENVNLSGFGGVSCGVLGGLIGASSNWDSNLNSKDSSSAHGEDQAKSEKTNNSGVDKSCSLNSSKAEIPKWNKTPGKGPKTDVPASGDVSNIVSVSSWGGTPAETNSGWMEPSLNTECSASSTCSGSGWKQPDSAGTSGVKKPVESKVDAKKISRTSGWGDVSDGSSNWEPSADVTGVSCWDNASSSAASKSVTRELKSDDKVSQWLQNSDVSGSDNSEWGQDSREPDECSEGSGDGWTTASAKRNRAPKPLPANDTNAWMSRSLKQLLDMGFKQEDAEKALKNNHMNIESAVGDLLSMALNEATNAPQLSTGGSEEPDPAEAARLQQLQQQHSQSKLNRKQRRRLQQQMQQHHQQQQIDPTQQVRAELRQTDVSSENSNDSSLDKLVMNQSQERDARKKDSFNTPQTTHPEIPSSSGATDQAQLQQTAKAGMTNPPTHLPPSHRKGSPANVQALIPGVPTPLRPGMAAHPLLQLQQQQLHLQQMRMAQGGLLQPPFSQQQLALLSQIAQLQMVQQRLAAQSVHLGKPGMASQQQLYQQQQQIALMIAQMQQQVLQPNFAGRFPGPQQQQQQQQQAQKGVPKQPVPDKGTSEGHQGKANEAPKLQAADASSVPASAADERSKQASPAPQSRLQQWKQPLLQDQPAVSSSAPSAVSTTDGSAPHTTSGLKLEASSAQPSAFTSPATISTNANAPTESPPSGNGLSPRNRISDPVSSRWGVDAGPKLSADPPEFKPGVPWRPAPRRENKDEAFAKDFAQQEAVGNAPNAVPTAWNKPSQVPNASLAASFPTNSSGNLSTESTDAKFAGNPAGGQPLFGLPLGTSAWQTPDDKDTAGSGQNASKPVASPGAVVRPPPGLSSENSFPESPLFGDDPPMWLRSLIGGPGQSAGGSGNQNELQFSRFDFANSGNGWGGREGSQQLNPAHQSWATPKAAASSTAAPVASTAAVATGTPNPASELPKRPTLVMSSWSANQPIPSAQEKVAVSASGPNGNGRAAGAILSSGQQNLNNPMSTWLVLRNLNPRVDPTGLRTLCQNYGPLLTFQLNLRHGNSLIRYGHKEQASEARAALNGRTIAGSTLMADFATDGDIGSFFEQTMDWSAGAVPTNAPGNQWSFPNSLGTGPGDVTQSQSQVPNMKPSPDPTSETSKAAASTPGMQWGQAPAAPSHLWSTTQPLLGSNFVQAPSVWSFPSGAQPDGDPQTGENGLVSPSMTTFLPPGLLNSGEPV